MSGLTPEQLPEYCDRLGKEFEKAKGKKDRMTTFKLKKLPELVDWREVRPNMNPDFVDNSNFREISELGRNTAINSQESKLINDLLSCFLGGNSSLIRAEPVTHKNAVRTFRIDNNLDVKLYDLTEKCLVMATYYSQLCRFVQDNRLLRMGRVNQALASAIDITLTEYKSFIVELERIHIQRFLSLQEVWFHIQDVMKTLDVMNNIALDVIRLESRGGTTLSYLHEQTSCLVEPQSQRDLLKYLTKRASTPYMQSIKEWIFNGIIFDPFEEFMITEKPKTSTTDIHSPEYWEKRYQLRKNCVPSFLEPVTNEIFKSGAYLNVIRESVVSYDKKLKLAQIEDLKYSWKSSKYLDVIRRAYIHSSSYLLSHMMEEYQLLDRFIFMKRYFLVQQGDFIVQVLDTCDEELSKLIADVIPSRLKTLVDMAIKGVEDSVRDNITIVLQTQDLSYQVSKILSVATTDEFVEKNIGLNARLTGFESFSLSMNCGWPVSLIFNARTISCYQMLFRLLFYCKHIERLLSRVWILDQRLRRLPTQQMKQYSAAFALRHKMIYFIQSMQYYIMEEAIEPNWIEFQLQLKRVTHSVPPTPGSVGHPDSSKKVNSIDDLLDVHKKFLDKCMNDCLLTNATLFPIFQTLLTICKEFVVFIIRMRRTQREAELSGSTSDLSDISEPSHFENDTSFSNTIITDGVTFSNTIATMDQRFQEQYILLLKSIAELAPSDDKATKIFEILHRANFNYFFSSLIDRFEAIDITSREN